MFCQMIFICTLVVSITGNDPQVYEKSEDQIQTETNTRVVRDPFKQQKQKYYNPPVFEYQAAKQQDPRKHRYAQQQRIDMENVLKSSKVVKNPVVPLRFSLVQNWKVADPTVSSSAINENYQLPEEEKNSTSIWNQIAQVATTKKPVTSRKLKPSSYYEDLDDRTTIKRQDQNSQIVYVNPEVIKDHFQVTPGSELDMNALNALIGQHPNIQLEGLKKLLATPQTNLVLPPIKGPLPYQIKDHTPIAEQTIDIPNFQTKPNIKTEDPSIQALQNQLDQATKMQFQKALAQAQEAAKAHVEAQHKAIAKVQEEAKRKALAAIALHNQAHQTMPPSALPLKAEASSHLYASSHQALPPLALPLKAEASSSLYAPSHTHHTQTPIIKVQSDGAKNLEKVKITKTHSITQGTRSPNAYQEVVLETQHQSQKVFPTVNYHELDGNVDDVSKPIVVSSSLKRHKVKRDIVYSSDYINYGSQDYNNNFTVPKIGATDFYSAYNNKQIGTRSSSTSTIVFKNNSEISKGNPPQALRQYHNHKGYRVNGRRGPINKFHNHRPQHVPIQNTDQLAESTHYWPVRFKKYKKRFPFDTEHITEKPNAYDEINKILKAQKEHQPANIIVINNSNNDQKHDHPHPAPKRFKKRVKKHKRIHKVCKPNIVNLQKIQNKVDLLLSKVF